MKRICSVFLALALLFSLAACTETGGQPEQTSAPPSVEPSVSPEPSQPETPGDSPSPDPVQPEDEPVRLAFLNGPTGIGAAKLLSDIDSGDAQGAYSYEVLSDNSEAVNLLTHGDVDIAALATNVALNLYNKTGDIQLLALNTRGVLYILEGSGGESIQTMADLEGKTLYAFGQGANPQYILEDLLRKNGLDPESSLTIQWATAEEAAQALLSGEADAVMLPVPAATAAIVKGGGDVRSALDLSAEWDAAYGGGEDGASLYMGCLAVRTEFAQAHPEAVQTFLSEYRASLDFVLSDLTAAAPMAEAHGLAPSAAIAEKAIPDCNLCFLAGRDMAPAITDYYMFLFEAAPDSIGGSLPDDSFYYVP